MPPSLQHEMPLEMISRRPAFALELLAWGLRADADGYHDPRHESVELNERLPAEYMADAVISIKGPDGRKRYVIVEIQRQYDKRKVWSWAAYVGGLMGRYQCAVMLVTVCTNRATADRYRRPIAPPDNCLILCPVVVGPDELPILREREDVLSSPEIATLSAIAHQDDFDTVVSVATALATFDDDRSLVYYDYLRGQLSEELRAKLEDIMIETAPRLPDRFTLPIEQEAEARGETRGEAKALLTLLAARNLTLTPDLRETVESCTDEEVLLRWTTRAATASSAQEVFGEG